MRPLSTTISRYFPDREVKFPTVLVGAMWSILGSLISRGLSLISAIVVARILGQVTFGELGIIQSTTVTFSVFAGLGLGIATTKHVANMRLQDTSRTGRIVAFTTLINFGMATFVTILVVLMAPYLATNALNNPNLAIPLQLSAGYTFFTIINVVQTGALAGFEAFKTIAITNLITGIASFPATILGAYALGLNGAIIGLTISGALGYILNFIAIRREANRSNVSYSFKDCWQEQHILWRFALPSALGSIIFALASWYCNLLLTKQASGFASLALISATQHWQSLILFLPTALGPLILARMSQLHTPGMHRSYWNTVRFSFIVNGSIAALGAICVISASGWIMTAYGTSFASGTTVLGWMALVSVLIALKNVCWSIITSSSSMWWCFLMDIVLSATLVLTAQHFVPIYAAEGLAVSYAWAYLAQLACLFLFILAKYICAKKILHE